MKCSKCESIVMSSRNYQIKELAKGSPTRGKNVKWVIIKVKEIKCRNCQTTELTYG